jgi:uncharacterized protein (DUF2235 family)
MMQMLESQLVAGDNVIDLFGFSRGSATALVFLNRVAERRRAGDRLFCNIEVRFVGLYDAVSSLRKVPGLLPSDDISSGRARGFRFSLPPDLHYTSTPVHFVSLDEQRAQFQQLDIRGALQIGYRGVHSDVGGSYGRQNPFSWLTLRDMVRRAEQAGVVFEYEALSRHTLSGGLDLFSRQIDPAARPTNNAQWYYNDHEQRIFPVDLVYDPSVRVFNSRPINRIGGP